MIVLALLAIVFLTYYAYNLGKIKGFAEGKAFIEQQLMDEEYDGEN